jgi:hypothetical protein
MANPGLADVHIDAALTDYSRAYFQAAEGFVWNKVAPLIPTMKQSDKYFVYDIAETARSDARKRAPGTESALRDYTLSQDSFFADVWSIGMDISEQVLANADDPLDPEQDAVRVLTEDIMIRLEQEFASTFFSTSIWGTDDTDENWSSDASDPIGALLSGINTVRGNTGYTPNTLVLGAASWYNALANHPDILSRIPSNLPQIATPQFLANLIGVQNVYVAQSIRNTAQENLTASFSDNLGAHALLCYVAPNPGPRTATAAAAFNWTGLTGAAGGIRTLRNEIPHKDAFPRIEVQTALDFKVVGSDLGYFFSAVTT